MIIGVIEIHLHNDTSQDQFDQYADAEISTEVNQPSGEQKQQLESVEDQQQKTSHTDIVRDGYRTRSGRLVKSHLIDTNKPWYSSIKTSRVKNELINEFRTCEQFSDII